MYTVQILDSIGMTTKPAYKNFRDAADVCRIFGNKIAGRKDLKLIYARVLDEDGAVLYDLTTDTYACDHVVYEKKLESKVA